MQLLLPNQQKLFQLPLNENMYERYCVPHFRMAGMATADKPVTVPSTMIPRYTDSTECSSRTKEPILVEIQWSCA